MQSVMYIHCCNRAELARCVETTVCHNCAQQTGTIDTCQGANAHWAMPHLSGRRSSLLKRVRFGYGSLTNLFSTTLSIQANSRVLTLTVSAKRKPVHSSYRDVTTKSERVIAHVIGSNLLWYATTKACRTPPGIDQRRLEEPTKSCDWNRALPLVNYILSIFSDKSFRRLPAVRAQDVPDVCSGVSYALAIHLQRD